MSPVLCRRQALALGGAWLGAAALPARAEAPQAGRFVVTEAGLAWDTALRRPRVRVPPDPAATARPVLAPGAADPDARLLRRWVEAGRAAGLAGVLYDNRDRGHSGLSPERFPQLVHLAYAPELVARDADLGLALTFLFDAPLLGNASLAITGGPLARSLPRLAMTLAEAPRRAYETQAANHLYVYPAHNDVAEVDLLPATLPHFVVSRGSSRSDRPFVEAFALALAALRPETRRRVEAEGLLVPTLQMLLRRTWAGEGGYLTPHAHPAAFEPARLRPGLMMALAQALEAGAIPPLPRLRVEVEDFTHRAGLAARTERLFDTPSAVARLWRGWAGRREMTLSAADTADPNGRPLRFHWVLLRGDPERVRIAPLDTAGSRVRLQVDWHDAPIAPLPGGLLGARVEVALVAWNGAEYSAPAFVSIAFPAHERRVHGPGPDGAPQLEAVDYDALGRGVVFDPLLWWSAPWRDMVLRGGDGALAGWRRRHADGSEAEVGIAIGPPAYEVKGGDETTPVLRELP